jgi:propanol-preferring alcohol dehydrogenase
MVLNRPNTPLECTDIPAFPYALLRVEHQLVSVANLTRQDGLDFLKLADMRAGRFNGAAVLAP